MISNINIKKPLNLFMAVPKKKMSKSKTNSRKSYWKKKAEKNTLLAISIGKSILKNNEKTNFISI